MKKLSFMYKVVLVLTLLSFSGAFGAIPSMAADAALTTDELIATLFATIDSMPNLPDAKKAELKADIAEIVAVALQEKQVAEDILQSCLTHLNQILTAQQNMALADFEDSYEFLELVIESTSTAQYTEAEIYALVQAQLDAGLTLKDALRAVENAIEPTLADDVAEDVEDEIEDEIDDDIDKAEETDDDVEDDTDDDKDEEEEKDDKDGEGDHGKGKEKK